MTTYSPGKYRAAVVDQGFVESPSRGTPGFFLQLRILKRYGANDALEACPEYERTLTQYLANATGVNSLLVQLKAIGVTVTDLAQLDPEAAGGVRLAGMEIDVECEVESYLGRERERWGIPRSRKKLKPDAIRALSDRFGHLLRNG